VNEISSEYGVHTTQITQWKKLVLDELPQIFGRPGSERTKSEEALIASLYQQIGQMKVELSPVKESPKRRYTKSSLGKEANMGKVQKVYSKEFKEEAVRPAQTSGKPIAQIARELDISDSAIHGWRRELAEHGQEAFPGKGHQTALEEENRRLKREYASHDEARLALFTYVEVYYNRIRRHSTLGYLSPFSYERMGNRPTLRYV
jgi:transposase